MPFKKSLICLSILFGVSAHAQEEVKYSVDSVSQGQRLFAMNCTSCHGNDGKATVNFVADATNLTDPTQWREGNTRAHAFSAIKGGQAVDMPAFEWILDSEEEIWHLTNFIISLWPEALREAALAE
jgi:mono/diheme cytochrome c family protein